MTIAKYMNNIAIIGACPDNISWAYGRSQETNSLYFWFTSGPLEKFNRKSFELLYHSKFDHEKGFASKAKMLNALFEFLKRCREYALSEMVNDLFPDIQIEKQLRKSQGLPILTNEIINKIVCYTKRKLPPSVAISFFNSPKFWDNHFSDWSKQVRYDFWVGKRMDEAFTIARNEKFYTQSLVV